MRTYLAAIAIGGAAVLATSAPAAAETTLTTAHLGQYCSSTHGAFGVQTAAHQLGYDHHGRAVAMCRVTPIGQRYRVTSERVEAVCRFVGEDGSFGRNGQSIVCRGRPSITPTLPGGRDVERLERNCERAEDGRIFCE